MVPSNGHCCIVLGRQNSTIRQYHVLFFGDEGERGWVLETTSLPYAGRAAFDRHCQSVTARLPAKDRKNYSIAPNRRRAWEVAVSSAEHAWTLSHEQRIDEFIPPMSSSGLHSLNPSRYSSTGGCILASHGFDVKLDGPGDCSTAVSPNIGSIDREVLPHRNVSQEQFAAFCRHNRKSLRIMHPGFTSEQIDRLLLLQWRESNSAEKSQYLGMCIMLSDEILLVAFWRNDNSLVLINLVTLCLAV